MISRREELLVSKSSSNQQQDSTGMKEYLFLEVESAHLSKRVGVIWNKMNPFVQVSILDDVNQDANNPLQGSQSSVSSSTMINVTPTHWDSQFDPQWFHQCPGIPLDDDLGKKSEKSLMFTVFHDSEKNKYRVMSSSSLSGSKPIGQGTISIKELIARVSESKKGSLTRLLGTKSPINLELKDMSNISSVGALQLQLSVKTTTPVEDWVLHSMWHSQIGQDNNHSARAARRRSSAMTRVDPTWFETPVERMGVSGGTAPFFRLILTEKGVRECQSRNDNDKNIPDTTYWIGKDLSHAQDEREFYETILQMKNLENLPRVTVTDSPDDDDRNDQVPTDCVNMLRPFFFDYLGILETKTNENTDSHSQLLVMQNLRNDYSNFRMLDLKMGQKTAQGGWKGKSHLRAFKHQLMDGLSNSAAEGFRLAGFNGCPKIFESFDPLIDILVTTPDDGNDKASGESSSHTSQKTLLDTVKEYLGTQVTESQRKAAKRFMLNSLSGDEIFQFFLDVHNEVYEVNTGCFCPVEMVEIVLNEIVFQLLRLAVVCHRVNVPQKWVGSSVAVGYDAGYLPTRSPDGEHAIRNKAFVKVFDWGRSELLTERDYQMLSSSGKTDRQIFWNHYKIGIDNLSFIVARTYYNNFTNYNRWSTLTIQVMDFDSMSEDDLIGTVTVDLPDPVEEAGVVETLRRKSCYEIQGHEASKCGSMLTFSLSWSEFPEESRLFGSWTLSIERATNLPSMDTGSSTSDPYCIVIARDDTTGKEMRTMTCVKVRCLNPIWDETFSLPILREKHSQEWTAGLAAQGIGTLTESQISHLFDWNDNSNNKNTIWSRNLANSQAGRATVKEESLRR